MGVPEERDYGSAIERMRNQRTVPALRETKQEDYSYPDETAEEAIERQRSEMIAQMARERGPRPGPELTEDQRLNIRRSKARAG
jgi:hypothetical protein